MFRSLILTTLSLLGAVATAGASPSVSFETEPEAIGRFNCEERLDQPIVLSASNDGSTSTTNDGIGVDAGVSGSTIDPDLHSLRIYYYIDDRSCLDEISLSDCTRLNIESGGFPAGSCGCLTEQLATGGVVSPISYNNALGNDGNIKAAFCDGTHTVFFIARTILKEQVNDGEQTTVDETSDAIELEFMYDLPPAPAGAPQVNAKEQALEISLAEDAPAEVVSHKVCVKPVSNPADTYPSVVISDETTEDELRNGFEETDCRTASALGSGSIYRYTDLSNDQTYDVAVIALDGADNPSPISEVAQGTPQELLDFAEVYRDRLGISGTDEHHPGELGGCSMNFTRTPIPLVALGLMGLVILGLRRKN